MDSFEDRLTHLEKLRDKIRAGETPLHEAVAVFESGVILARELEKELGSIERRIEILVNSPQAEGEKPLLELFPELGDEATAQQGDE